MSLSLFKEARQKFEVSHLGSLNIASFSPRAFDEGSCATCFPEKIFRGKSPTHKNQRKSRFALRFP